MEFINLSLVFGNTEEADWVTIKKSFNRATEQISEIYSTPTNHTAEAFYFLPLKKGKKEIKCNPTLNAILSCTEQMKSI